MLHQRVVQEEDAILERCWATRTFQTVQIMSDPNNEIMFDRVLAHLSNCSLHLSNPVCWFTCRRDRTNLHERHDILIFSLLYVVSIVIWYETFARQCFFFSHVVMHKRR